MRICVFVRPVHQAAFPIDPSAALRVEELPGYRPVPNPWDELALEFALALRDTRPDLVRVTLCSVGGEGARAVLRELVACGADRAVCIDEPQWEPDAGVVAMLLRDYARAEPFDLGLFGDRDPDRSQGTVGPMVSALTGMAYFDRVLGLHWDRGRTIEVARRQPRATERLRLELPVCLGVLRGAPLRYPSFWGKLRAGQGVLSTRGSLPLLCERLERVRFTPAKPRRRSGVEAVAVAGGRMAQVFGLTTRAAKKGPAGLMRGEPPALAQRLLRVLREERVLDREEV